MKITILVILFFVSFHSLYGQGFQVGLRAGLSKWYETNLLEGKMNYPDKGQNIFSLPPTTFDKVIFTRYEHKSWAFEANLNYYSNKHSENGYRIGGDFMGTSPNYYYSLKSTGKHIDISVSLQKRLFKIQRLSDHIGLMAAIQRDQITFNETDIMDDSTRAYVYKDGKINETYFLCGLSNIISYHLYKGLTISAAFQYSLEPGTSLSRNWEGFRTSENSKLSIQFGIAYSIK